MLLAVTFLALLPYGAQDVPVRLTGKLPAKALCIVCSLTGETGLEKPAASVQFQGKTFYFCKKSEVDMFIKKPDSFIAAPLPREMPDSVFRSVKGGDLPNISRSSGVVLVDFWATWCKPCIKAIPDIEKLHVKYAAQGVRVIGISIDENEGKAVLPWLSKLSVKPSYALGIDVDASFERWGVRALPSLLLIKDGKIVQHWTGIANMQVVERAIRDAIQR